MNHDAERTQDRADRKQVADLRGVDSSVIKWLGGSLTLILGFLALMVINDHSTLSGMVQWQGDHERYFNEIDIDHTNITNMAGVLEAHWGNMADSTNLTNQ